MQNAPHWVHPYKWPETFLFKHLEKYQLFKFNKDGESYARISARRYVPARLIGGKLHMESAPVEKVASINTFVLIGPY